MKDRTAELQEAWKASPGAADWDMDRSAAWSRSRSPTGSHDAPYTIYLTTFTSKKVPGFAVYQTVDVPNDDSMDFADRAGAFFTVVTGDSLFPGVTDREAFMKWYASEMSGKYFIRLQQTLGRRASRAGLSSPPTPSRLSRR